MKILSIFFKSYDLFKEKMELEEGGGVFFLPVNQNPAVPLVLYVYPFTYISRLFSRNQPQHFP